MTKVETWTGHTQTHGFNAEVFDDSAAGEFKAEVVAHTPKEIREYLGGSAQPDKFEVPITITANDIDSLRERVKEHIRSRFGEIKIFDKK